MNEMIDNQMIDDRIQEATVKSSKLVSSAKEMTVYKRAYAISLEIHKTTLSFPKIEQYDLASQMRRASKSICANLSEGFAKQAHSSAEFGRFVSMAIGSAGEMLTWTDYCHDLKYITQDITRHWLDEYKAILKMLQKLKMNI